jgi:hypothetical protein
MVFVCEGVKVGMRVRVSVSVDVLVEDGVLVGVVEGRFVEVHSRVAVGATGRTRWGILPVMII